MTKLQKTILVEAVLVLTITLVLALLVGCGPAKARTYDNMKDAEQDDRLAEIERRLAAMTNAYQNLLAQIAATDSAQAGEIGTLQTSANLLTAQIAALQANVLVTAIIDPCGDGPGFDEIILKTSAGYMAYFQSGSERFLTLLPHGNYQTTDGTGCSFTVGASGLTSNGATQ